jgi:hypothetical protein
MTLSPNAIQDLILKTAHDETAPRAFPSGVHPGDDRNSFLNASEAGLCTRWIWFRKHGVAGAESNPVGVFARGHAAEHYIATHLATALKRTGGRLLYAGADQKRLMLSGYRLAGTPDGLAVWADGSESVLEIKSHGTLQSYDGSPAAMHVAQVEINIELFHEVTKHRPEDGLLVYILAEDFDRLALHRVERRPAAFIEMVAKAGFAFDAASAAEVTAEGVGTRQCVLCPYRSKCIVALMAGIPAAGTAGLKEATLRDIDRLVAARQGAIEAEEEAAGIRIEIEAELVELLAGVGAKRVKRNGYSAGLKKQKDGSAVLDIRCA